MSFVHFYPRDAVAGASGVYAPDAYEKLRALEIEIGPDLEFDSKHPYARLFIRTLSPEYGAHVFSVLSALDWVAAYAPPIGDYELAATSAFASHSDSVFAHEFHAGGSARVVQSAAETFEAIYPAFDAWCALGEISPGNEK